MKRIFVSLLKYLTKAQHQCMVFAYTIAVCNSVYTYH